MKKIYLLLTCLFVTAMTYAQCEASMEVTTDGNLVTVTITGSGASAPAYVIDWGDETQDFTATATHEYTASGDYLICFYYLDQNDPFGCNQSACESVIITGTGCTLDFSPFAFGLTASVTGNGFGATSPGYTINWGDGSPVEYSEEGFHSYAEAGTYNICMTYTDFDNADNCTLDVCHEVVVTEQSGDCTVDLSVSVDGGMAMANAVGSGAVNENYIITWDDNSYDNSASAMHNYDIAGTYTVCVIYGDLTPGGCQVQDCQEITIEEVSTGDCTLSINVNVLGMNVAVTADASGATNPQFAVTWDDGSADGDALPALHTYAETGVYEICVSYVDLDNLENCQVVECTEVTIEETTSACEVNLVVTQNGATINATATGTGAATPVYGISWGDGSFPAIGATGSHTYTENGTYQVCAVYFDQANAAGCNVTDCETVVITGIGVDEYILGENALRVMPNPLADNSTIQLTLNRASNVEMDVLDLIGNKVETIVAGMRGIGLQRISWNTESLSSGIYFIRVKAGDDERTIKVIK